MQGFRLIIVGIAVSAALGSFNTWLMLTVDLEVAMRAAAWGAGSLNGTSWDKPPSAAPSSCCSSRRWLAALSPGLRQLELGEGARANACGDPGEAVPARRAG